MKPLGRKNYGSIPHLSTSKLGEHDHYITEGQERIITQAFRDRHDSLVVTEKYDGSNVGLANIDGSPVTLTRSGHRAKFSRFAHHRHFAEWAAASWPILISAIPLGYRLVFEWMTQPHGILYAISGTPAVLIDAFDGDNNRLPWSVIMDIGKHIGVSSARLLYAGDAPRSPVDLLHHLYATTGPIIPLAGQVPEGMVFRLERKGEVDFLAKWVRPDFVPGKYLDGSETHRFFNK